MMANEAKRGNAHVMMPSISGLYIKKIASLSTESTAQEASRPTRFKVNGILEF